LLEVFIVFAIAVGNRIPWCLWRNVFEFWVIDFVKPSRSIASLPGPL